MTAPRATMRLQFHAGFTFADAIPLVSYLARLGVSHVYASPIMTARPGSAHGYDVTDPAHINPELGGESGFHQLVGELRRHQMGIILDIVPNHMAIGQHNKWWMDVLAGGRDSRYAKYFDIDWTPPDRHLHGKVLLPILGRPYGEALAAGEIEIRPDDTGVWSVRYFDHAFPLSKETSVALDAVSIPAGKLHDLLERQHYRLAWWRSANDAINWRRFFDINELVAIRIEDDEVFEAVHATVFRLYESGLIDGVRVDHIDGLAQPADYCRKLRARLRDLEAKRPKEASSGAAYLIVEKILSRNETLPKDWETDGTTGYDFMDEVNALQHDEAGAQPLTALWQRISGRPGNFDPEEESARRQILERSFSAQRDGIVAALADMVGRDLDTRDIATAAIRRCLTEILAHFPVYRIYARVGQSSDTDRKFLSDAVTAAKTSCMASDRWLVEKLGHWLIGEWVKADTKTLQNIALARFAQLSAPLCAKAVEDTAFYRYGRLISRNDVGFDTRKLASSAADFHEKMRVRAEIWPRSLLATATHDHKRGEDVRSRLAVLSEFPTAWGTRLEHWLKTSLASAPWAGGQEKLSAADLDILFQTIVGAWPMTLTSADAMGLAAYAQRIAAWQQKALREAKLHSDWSAPNEAYERAAADFISWLFAGDAGLLAEIEDFVQRIAAPGAVNGLAQVLAKLTAPGVPDIYQGTEFWDLSLVDPDNRAAVDFAARQNSLGPVKREELQKTWRNGHIKQYVIARALAMRNKMARTFAEGLYVPLDVLGRRANHAVAYGRVLRNAVAIVVFCRCVAHSPLDASSLSIPAAWWDDTRLRIPAELRSTCSDIFAPAAIISVKEELALGPVLSGLPLAFLTNRGAR